MRMKILSFENEINFSDDFVEVLQVENTRLFTGIVNSIYKMSIGIEDNIPEKVVLEENNKILSFEKESLFVMDFMNFDFGQKKIQNALYHYVEDVYNLEYERLEQFQTTISNLNLDMLDILIELPFEYECKENIAVVDYLKMTNLKIKQQGEESVLERLQMIIDSINYFHLAKMLILVNVKTFLDKEEQKELYKYSKYKKVNLLLLESGKEVAPIEYERILFVDNDFDEFLLYNKRRE